MTRMGRGAPPSEWARIMEEAADIEIELYRARENAKKRSTKPKPRPRGSLRSVGSHRRRQTRKRDDGVLDSQEKLDSRIDDILRNPG